MIQDIDTVSLIKRYPLGMRYALDDRVFRYARAGNILHGKFPVKSHLFQHVKEATLAATSLTGLRQVSINIAATDGRRWRDAADTVWTPPDGEIPADELAEGYVCFHLRDGEPRQRVINRKILKNTATPAGGGVMVLTVDKPLSYDLVSGGAMYVDCMASQYRDVRRSGGGETHQSVVGVPTMSALALEYLWIQTWGPCVPNADVNVGVNPVERQVVFGPDGNLHPIVEAETTAAADIYDSTQAQRAGYVICNDNQIACGRGAPFIFLQITP